jgi:ABC-type methionine transport system permease subunit
MKFIKSYFYNLITMALFIIVVIIGMIVFTKIFYPGSISSSLILWQTVGQIISAFKLWPIVILMLLMLPLTRRRR